MTHTDKPDWADEAVKALNIPLPNYNFHYDIAAALRKAKADGMREAMHESHSNSSVPKGVFDYIMELAAKIEKGQS